MLLGHWKDPEVADRPAQKSINVTFKILNNTGQLATLPLLW